MFSRTSCKRSHLRNSVHQVCQVDDAQCQLLELVAHRTPLMLFLQVATFAPVLSVITDLVEVLANLPQHAYDRLRQLCVLQEG